MYKPLLVSVLFSAVLYSQTPSNVLSMREDDLQPEIYRLIDQGNIPVAEQTVRSYLGNHEQSATAHYLLGYVLFKKHDPKASLAEYTIAARYRTPKSYDLEVVASDYVLLKDYTDADKWFSKSVEMNPANLSALYYLGRTKYNENRFDEAISVFERCLKTDPSNVKYEDNLGLSYQGLGRSDEADAAYRAAIDWDRRASAHNSGPYLDLGSLLVDSGHAPDAVPYLVEAARISPDDLRVHTQLGKAYLHSDQLEKAQAELEEAVSLDPRNAPAHFVLSQVYRKRGLVDKARVESETFTTLNRDHSTDQ
jgi:tetratricopeptide (TPR) repeat protein